MLCVPSHLKRRHEPSTFWNTGRPCFLGELIPWLARLSGLKVIAPLLSNPLQNEARCVLLDRFADRPAPSTVVPGHTDRDVTGREHACTRRELCQGLGTNAHNHVA